MRMDLRRAAIALCIAAHCAAMVGFKDAGVIVRDIYGAAGRAAVRTAVGKDALMAGDRGR